MRKLLILSVSLAALAQPAMAQERGKTVSWGGFLVDEDGNESGNVDGIRTLPDTQITVTASGTELELENTGQAVTVIGREEIESVQGPDLARVLRRAPGVSISRNGGVGSFTGLRVRGAASEQLLVLVDRVPVNDPSAPGGGFDMGNLLAGNIQVIDLTRSANSTIWGADAFAGVLDVTTSRVTGLNASAEYGSDKTIAANAAGGLELGEGYIGLAGSYYTSDGFSAAADGAEADGFTQWAVSGQASYPISYSLTAFANARYAKGDLDIDGFPAPFYALADTAETQETTQYSGAAGLTYNDDGLYLTARYSLSDIERANFDPPFSPDPTFTSDGHTDRADLRGEWRSTGGFVANFGGEYRWQDYRTTYDTGATTHMGGAYLQLGMESDKLAAHIGVRRDEHARFGGETSFGADASLALGGHWRARASVGEGFKVPTLFQLFSDYGNDTLRPERATSYDVALIYGGRDTLRFGEHDKFRDALPVYGAVTLFRRDSRDLIDYVSCWGSTAAICDNRPFGTYDNVGKARAQGVEVELGLAPSETLRLQTAYSYVDTKDLTEGAFTQGNVLARRPRHMLSLALDWQTPLAGLRLGGDIRMVGDSFDDAWNTRRLDGYALVDLRASLPLGERFELFGRVENVTDTDYQTASGYAQRGRAGFAGVRVRM